MKEKYMFMIVIFAFAFIITSAISRIFKKSSGGNSIKQEEKITFENISFLIEGIFCLFSIYLVSKFQVKLAIPVFYIEIALILIIFLDFIRNLFKEIFGYVSYAKKGSMWSIIGVQFVKVIIIAYLVYNYYTIYIQ